MNYVLIIIIFVVTLRENNQLNAMFINLHEK